MKQVLLIEQEFPSLKISDRFDSTGSNYANYQGGSVTKGSNAFIDIMEDVIVIIKPKIISENR